MSRYDWRSGYVVHWVLGGEFIIVLATLNVFIDNEMTTAYKSKDFVSLSTLPVPKQDVQREKCEKMSRTPCTQRKISTPVNDIKQSSLK